MVGRCSAYDRKYYTGVKNAAASSEMEGIPVEQRHFEAIQQIKDSIITLQEYFQRLKISARKS